MSTLRTVPLALLLAGIAGAASAVAEPPYPPRALLLFVASWCAPCRAEIGRLDAIAASAEPLDVRVVPLDRTSATAAMLRGVPSARVWRSASAADAFVRDRGSLPFAIMTDAAGRACATYAYAVDSAAVTALRRRCGI